MVPVCAFALAYNDPAGDFSIEIPEEAGAYYYTPGGTNMSQELLDSIKDKDTGLALLIASYATQTDNALSYSLDISEAPLSLSASPEATTLPTQDPAASASAANVPDVTDFSMINDDQISVLVAQKQAEYGADYVFDPYTTEQLNGKTAIVLTGRLAEDNGYTTKIYMIAQNNTNFTITVLYKNDDANTYLNQAMASLQSLQFTSAVATPGPSAKSTVVPTPQPTIATITAPEPVPTASPESTGLAAAGAFFSNLGNNIQDAYYNDPNFVFYILGAAVIIAVIIIIILLIKSRGNKGNGRHGNKPSLPDDNVGPTIDSMPEEPKEEPKTDADYFNARYQKDISRYTQQPDGYDLSDVSRYTQQPEGYQAQQNSTQSQPDGYDLSDINRYTQQPSGYDLSDVSRYTQQPKGYQKSTADISERPETAERSQRRVPLSTEAAKPDTRRDSRTPKVGSRVARNKKKQ